MLTRAWWGLVDYPRMAIIQKTALAIIRAAAPRTMVAGTAAAIRATFQVVVMGQLSHGGRARTLSFVERGCGG